MFRIDCRGAKIEAERSLRDSSNKSRQEMWEPQKRVVEQRGKKWSDSVCILKPDRVSVREKGKLRITPTLLT